MHLSLLGRHGSQLLCMQQVVGVNDWDTDVVTIGTSDDSAQNLPLVHDVLGCPGLQVGLIIAMRCLV